MTKRNIERYIVSDAGSYGLAVPAALAGEQGTFSRVWLGQRSIGYVQDRGDNTYVVANNEGRVYLYTGVTTLAFQLDRLQGQDTYRRADRGA